MNWADEKRVEDERFSDEDRRVLCLPSCPSSDRNRLKFREFETFSPADGCDQ